MVGFVQVEICNVGNLPARKVSWVINYERNSDNDWSVPGVLRDKARGSVTIAPGGNMVQAGPGLNVLTGPQNELGVYVYVWGAAFYEDGFGGQRTTRFCHRYNLARIQKAVGVSSAIDAEHARYHREGNEAD
jgi:hypothetical protein